MSECVFGGAVADSIIMGLLLLLLMSDFDGLAHFLALTSEVVHLPLVDSGEKTFLSVNI